MSLFKWFRKATPAPAPPPPPVPAAPSPAHKLLAQARRALRSENARTYAREQALPDAERLISMGETALARTLLADALAEYPHNALRWAMVKVLRMRGERGPAAALLTVLAADAAFAAEAELALGELAEDAGQLHQARRHLERALAVDPSRAVVRDKVRRLRSRMEGNLGLPEEQWLAMGRLWAQTAAGSGYRVVGEVGRGGAATLFKGQDVYTGQDVALKVFHPRGEAGMRAERVRQEARLAVQAAGPGVVPVLDAVPQRDLMVLPYFAEGSLRARLAATPAPLDAAVVLPLLHRLCVTLARVHGLGVLHLDIKPSNILLHDGWPVLTDFGAAAAHTMGQAAGTPPYLAPEVAAGNPPTSASDIYAVGVLMVELLSGHARADAAALAQHPAWQAVAEHLVAADPNQRVADAGLVAGLMAALLQQP